MKRKPPLSSRKVKKLAERERALGLDQEDDAARWLEEHDPLPAPSPSKSAAKVKVLHRWRQRQAAARKASPR
jgi:hypothetical protein